MHREDRSNYLLYIEPPKKEKLPEPVNDSLTELMEKSLERSKKGTAQYSDMDSKGNFRENNAYKGFHSTECGERSTNQDYLLENGMITNSLAPFYLKWYRNSIPESEIEKLMNLRQYYGK